MCVLISEVFSVDSIRMACDPPKHFVILDLRMVKPCSCPTKGLRHMTCAYHRILQMAPCCGLHHGWVITCHECYRDMWPVIFYAQYTRAFLKQQARIPENVRVQYDDAMAKNGLSIDWIVEADVKQLPEGDNTSVAQEIYALISLDEAERLRRGLISEIMHPRPLDYLVQDNGAEHGCIKYVGIGFTETDKVYYYSPTRHVTWNFDMIYAFDIGRHMGNKVPTHTIRAEVDAEEQISFKTGLGKLIAQHRAEWKDVMREYMYGAFKAVRDMEMTKMPATNLASLNLKKTGPTSQLPAAMADVKLGPY